MAHTTLHIDTSARHQNSTTRSLTQQILEHLAANFTPADQRTDDQKQTLALSDQLVDEIARADTLVIGLPIYNFSVPASLKAWIDQVFRAGVTFQYTDTGPQSLMPGKRAIIAISSGGTPVGSYLDFASGYLRHALGFIGITDVTFISADNMMADPDAALASAKASLLALAA